MLRLSKRKAYPRKSPSINAVHLEDQPLINLAAIIQEASSSPYLSNHRAKGTESLPPICRSKPVQPESKPAFEPIRHTVPSAAPSPAPVPLPTPFQIVTRRSASIARAASPAITVTAPDAASNGKGRTTRNKVNGNGTATNAVLEKLASTDEMRRTRSAPSHQARTSRSPPEQSAVQPTGSEGTVASRRPKRTASSQNINMSISDDEEAADGSSRPSPKKRRLAVQTGAATQAKRASSVGPTSPLAKSFAVETAVDKLAAAAKRPTRMASPLRFSNSDEEDSEANAASAPNSRRSGSGRVTQDPSHLSDYQM